MEKVSERLYDLELDCSCQAVCIFKAADRHRKLWKESALISAAGGP